MRWIVEKLVGAMVAGVGWKLGADAYEAVKKHLQERSDRKDPEQEDNGGGATETHSVDVDGNGPREGAER